MGTTAVARRVIVKQVMLLDSDRQYTPKTHLRRVFGKIPGEDFELNETQQIHGIREHQNK